VRHAYYYDDIVPPREWLVQASLLWERVWCGCLPSFIANFSGLMQADQDGQFLHELFVRTDIIATGPPAFDDSLLPDDLRARHGRMTQQLSKALDYIIEGVPFEIEYLEPGRESVSIDPIPKRPVGPPTFHDVRRMSTLFNNGIAPAWVDKGFPDLDFFFGDQRAAIRPSSAKANVLVRSIEAVLPVNVGDITLSQLIDFRETTRLRRLQFGRAADDLLNDVIDCSTEHDLQRAVRLCEEYIREQLSLLDVAYAACKMEAARRVMGVTFTAPALVAALSSAVHVPFYLPAAIVSSLSLASAEVLLALEKRRDPKGAMGVSS